jgi:hypothetical protein
VSSLASLRSCPADEQTCAQDLVLTPGEAAEFDTHVPHWFGCASEDRADGEAVEFLVLFGSQGERAHLRVRPKASAD